MTGSAKGTARSRARPSSSRGPDDPLLDRAKPPRRIRKAENRDHGPLRLMDVGLRTLLALGFGFLALLLVVFLLYGRRGGGSVEEEVGRRLARVVTPLPAPKMMDLPQFQGEHKESLYWGTYRPNVYLGIRARMPKSLIAGLMWIGIKNGQYSLRHVCQDSDDLSKYGWTDHNGRDYGRQVLVDQGMSLTTSFLKSKGDGSGYGGDWAVRLDVKDDRSSLDEDIWSTGHLFFYMADEEGNSLSVGEEVLGFHDITRLVFGSRKDVGSWELYLESKDSLEIHYAAFRTLHMHNLTELVQGTLATYARRMGRLQLPDASEDSSNVIVFQITTKLPSQMNIAYVSGTDSRSSKVEERVSNLTGSMLTKRLDERQQGFKERYIRCFNLQDTVDSEEFVVGMAALSNMLGGIGYFYGQSKIALPKGFSLKNGDKFIYYWPSALFTAVPSRSFFPRGFLWDEGFHQLLIWRWDIDICMDIVGHWLDLINLDGWIPREEILGAEALSKVPEEFVLQHPTNGNPPTLFLLLRDLLSSIKEKRFSDEDSSKIFTFLERAYVRLGAWFQWFNTTQSGKDMHTFFWHGRDNMTIKELNPKTLSSGLDDYPRASHPSDDEHHLDLRCWMLLSARCMHSIAEVLDVKDDLRKDYSLMAEQLSDFEILNQMHLDDASGAYFDFGNHTEKVRLRWHEVKDADNMRRELIRETLERPQLTLVPHVGYVSLFPFMMAIIPPTSWILEKQLGFISNRTTLWTDYGLRSLSKTSTLYMRRNTEHDPPYWRGPIWINMNYLILSSLHHYSQVDGPYRARAGTLYKELRSNLIRNIVRNYYKTGFLWEQYDQKYKGKGKGARPFTGWTSLVLLIMAEAYPSL